MRHIDTYSHRIPHKYTQIHTFYTHLHTNCHIFGWVTKNHTYIYISIYIQQIHTIQYSKIQLQHPTMNTPTSFIQKKILQSKNKMKSNQIIQIIHSFKIKFKRSKDSM